jgi:hypothetical protein
MIEIQLKVPKGTETVLSNLSENIRNNLLQGMLKGIELIIATSVRKYMTGPYPSTLSTDTGRLRQGLYGFAGFSSVAGEFIRAVMGNQVKLYAKVHEQTGEPGTKFPIFARNLQKGMTFFWKQKGIWVHGAKVVHIPARPFLKPAIMDNKENIAKLLNKAVRDAYREVK